jgi:hypothetical protein
VKDYKREEKNKMGIKKVQQKIEKAKDNLKAAIKELESCEEPPKKGRTRGDPVVMLD